MDERLHLVGVGTVDSYGVVTETDVPVKIVFSGLTLSLRVPKNLALDANGVFRFTMDETVKVDCIVEEQSSVRTFDKNTYVQSALRVKRVLFFDKVKG